MYSKKRGFQIEDLYKLELCYEPRISPDGSQVAFVVKKWNKEKDKIESFIKISSIDGQDSYYLTTMGSEKFIRWSPDGKNIAYISSYNKKKRIWVIDLADNKTHCLNTKQDVDSPPVWSPDSQKIAFSALASGDSKEGEGFYPGSPYSKDCCQGVNVITKFYHKYDGVGFFANKNQHIFIIDMDSPSGEEKIKARQLTAGNRNYYDPIWSPDGKYIACVVIKEGVIDRGVHKYDLIRLNIEKAQEEIILNSNGPIKSPVWSPDCKYIAYIGHQNPAGRVSNDNIWLVPLKVKKSFPLKREETLNITEKLDRPVGMPIDSDITYNNLNTRPLFWPEGSNKIYFLAGSRGSSFIYSVDIKRDFIINKEAGERGKNITFFHLDNRGQLVFSWCSPIQPDELYFININHQDQLKQITHLNQELLQEIEFSKPEQIPFTGPEGWEIDGWIFKPPEEYKKPYPLVLLIHGGPHLAYGNSFMIQPQLLATEGFAVFYCNPRGSQTYGQEFASAVVQDWGGKDYQDIIAGVDYIQEKGLADPERLGVMGWSYGGYMTNWITTRTDRFKAGISGASVSNLYSFYGTSDIGYSFGEFETGGSSCFLKEKLIQRSPINSVEKINTPLLLIHGEKDLRCPVSQSEELFTALKRCDKEAVFIRYPGEYHLFMKPSHNVDRYRRTIAWFKYYLK